MPLGRRVIGQKVKAGQIPSRCHTVLPRLPPTTNFSPAEQLQLISENFDSNVRILKALGCDAQSLDELLHRFVHNGTWLDPTIQSFRYWAPTQWSAIFSEFRELVPSIRQNHVSILAGTDSSGVLEEKGDPLGTSLHDELALLVDAGFTPSEAPRAATLNHALFLGLSDSLGTIEVGKKPQV